MIVSCPGCDAEYDVAPQPEGTRGRCRCGILFRIDPPPSHTRGAAPSARACPRCHALLWTRRIADVTIDDCAGCGGSFVERGQLERIVNEASAARAETLRACYGADDGTVALPSPVGAAYVKCPSCGGVMNRQRFLRDARVIVDDCREHGAWFDAHRLARALAIIEQGGPGLGQRVAQAQKRELDAANEAQRRAVIARAQAFHAAQKARRDAGRRARGLLDWLK